MAIEFSFHGGVDTVTGSCCLVRTRGLNILVDCGLFQGDRACEDKNYEEFAFDPAAVDYVLLTHGHLDHCGRIPLLVKRGFRGRILATPATLDIAKVVLMDTAGINEEDYAQWKKVLSRRGEVCREPLYTTLDVLDAIGYFDPRAHYAVPLHLGEMLEVNYRDAGHILGAAFIEVGVEDKKIVFSGDLGNVGKPIIRDPEAAGSADIVVMESTYADRNHKDFAESVREFADAVRETFRRGGNVLIPAFAIERAQELLFVLRNALEDGALPECRVFLDSPMAIRITNIMRRHPECFDEETRELFRGGRDPFDFPGLQLTGTPEESRRINDVRNNAVIIAGSGMMTGGRIKHHLKHNIWREESSIIFVGYQAEGTLGRQIVDGAREVRVFDQLYRVHARVYTIGGFSSHAGRDGLAEWIAKTGNPSHVFLVHGEDKGLHSFKTYLETNRLAGKVHIPHLHQAFTI